MEKTINTETQGAEQPAPRLHLSTLNELLDLSQFPIKTDEDVPPTFVPVPIVDCLAKISRNGITLEKEKKAAQVLCAGEIRIGDKVSPFELDLILDISYVSATKCTHCAFKVERYKRQGEYLIIQTDISLYANN